MVSNIKLTIDFKENLNTPKGKNALFKGANVVGNNSPSINLKENYAQTHRYETHNNLSNPSTQSSNNVISFGP